MTVDELLQRLQGVKRTGSGYMARCPAHADHTASLHVGAGDDGCLLLHCFAGCATADVVASLHLTMSDLFPTKTPRDAIVAAYDYRDERGTLLFQTVRLVPKAFRQRRPDGASSWVWSLEGIRRVLYRLPELVAAEASQTVFVCEGEKDVDRLAALGLVATTNACGAGKWRAEYNAALRGRPVVILPDADEPGRRHAQQVAASLRGIAASLKILELPNLPAKGDVSDWLNEGGDSAQLQALAEATPEAELSDLSPVPFSPPLRSEDLRPKEKGEPIAPLLAGEGAPAVTAGEGERSAPPEGWLPIADVLDCLARSEWGDAEMMARLYGGQIAFDHALERWFLFRGPYWEQDRTDQVRAFVSEGIALQYEHAAHVKEQVLAGAPHSASKPIEATLRALRHRLHTLHDSMGITRVLREASAQPELALAGDEWDADPMSLVTLDGVVDLRTGESRPGEPADYLQSHVPTRWLGLDAPCDRFERYIREILDGDAERVEFLQRLMGYGLTGQATEHILPVLHGAGRNGKDTLLETLQAVLGPQLARPISNDVLIESGRRDPNAPTPALYDLRGLRIGWVNESNEGARLNVSQVKWIVGGGTIWAQPLHGQPVTFEPHYLLLLETNNLPHANADDYALWQRLLLLRFTQSYIDDPRKANEHPRDLHLRATLADEASGILAWLVRGALAYQREGLHPPDGVKLATESYQAEEDTLGQFIEERCEVGPAYEVRAAQLYQAYRAWSEETGLRSMSSTAFGRRMGKRYEKKHAEQNVYLGIGLKA